MNVEDDKDGAAVKFPPPLIYLMFMLVAYVLNFIHPMGLGLSFWLNSSGVVVTLLGLAMVAMVSRSFRRAETPIQPWKPTTKMVFTGVYAYSRNPAYVGFCFVLVGLGIALNSLWVFLSFVPSAILVYHVAIRKEEAYLEEKFGEEYLQYKRKVRRWL